MKTIHKYQLDTQRDQIIHMPEGAEILSAAEQYGVPCIWALVDDEAPKAKRMIHIDMTGGNSERRVESVFIGTVLLAGGTFVIHIFDGGV